MRSSASDRELFEPTASSRYPGSVNCSSAFPTSEGGSIARIAMHIIMHATCAFSHTAPTSTVTTLQLSSPQKPALPYASWVPSEREAMTGGAGRMDRRPLCMQVPPRFERFSARIGFEGRRAPLPTPLAVREVLHRPCRMFALSEPTASLTRKISGRRAGLSKLHCRAHRAHPESAHHSLGFAWDSRPSEFAANHRSIRVWPSNPPPYPTLPPAVYPSSSMCCVRRTAACPSYDSWTSLDRGRPPLVTSHHFERPAVLVCRHALGRTNDRGTVDAPLHDNGQTRIRAVIPS
ncbi:hypothetical protein C8Q78DRAFT_196107 [Trametes maxima]|nr:hypothetical protein C8Q78DRAFT_196107 [Trametes maxima]